MVFLWITIFHGEVSVVSCEGGRDAGLWLHRYGARRGALSAHCRPLAAADAGRSNRILDDTMIRNQ